MYKSVLVTGASSGIGEACAIHLAHKGFKVFAGARRLEKLKTLAGIGGDRITPLELDVTDANSIKSAMTEIEKSGSPLFALVNNAGISVTGPVEEVAIGDWRRQFETNVFGAVAMIQAVLPQMRAAGEGRIVNIGSVAGRIVSPFMGAYGASKHALEGLNDALRREVKQFGVKVSLIRPGFINTPFGEQEQEGFAHVAEGGGPYAKMAAIFKAWHAKGHPAGASPNDVVDVVYEALTAARPYSRYTAPPKYIGPIILRNTMPSFVTDRIFERVTGVDRL
jgi:NAD(P)-dependent dehydrogenase (short-subunit alcohol dehydrogenase family)